VASELRKSRTRGAPIGSAEGLARRVAETGGEVAYVRTHVRRREGRTSLVNLASDRYGQLDVPVAEFTDCPICLPIVNAPP